MRLFKICIIAVFCCFLVSCSLIKTAYNNAPALTIWWLDDYFNFTPAQNLALKPSLQNLHHWHRQNELPNYLTQLQSIQTSLGNEQISAADVCKKLDFIRTSIYTLQVESIPIIVEIAPLLSDKQLKRFQNKLAERAEKWKQEWWQETKPEQLKVRLEKTQDFVEKIYGNLNNTQLMFLKQSLEQAAINPATSHKEILRRNDDAFTILKALQNNALSIDEKTQLIKAGFNRLQNSPNLAYQSYADKLTNHTCETMANLHASTNAQQKLHAKNWLQDYINQLMALQNKTAPS